MSPSEKTSAGASIQSDFGTDNHAATSESNRAVFWIKEEEDALVRKVDFLVLPLLWLGFFALQLDRGNIGNAATDNFMADVGISQPQFNTGASLMSAGIVALELPSNIVLMRIGPKFWLAGQIIAWGLVATFQAFQHGPAAFYTTRLLLGLGEAGYIPGSLYTISLWYKTEEISKRFSIFFTGNLLAAATGGLFAYGILHMRGIAGLTGWQWLFIIEGVFTILVGIFFVFMFPGSPANPKSILRVGWFTEREVRILQDRVLLQDATKGGEKQKISLKHLKETFSDYKLWLHLAITLATLAPATIYSLYGPTIIASFGYEKLRANAMVSVGHWLSAVLLVVSGYIADKWGRRGLMVLICVFIELTFTLAYKLLPLGAPNNVRYALFVMSMATMVWWHPINGSWLSLNSRSPTERSVRMAMMIMAANCAGIYGAQVLRPEDAPLYSRGSTVAVCLVAVGVSAAATLVVVYFFLNRKIVRKHGNTQREDDQEGPKLYNF
ncbi:alternative sulfate transporter [Microdochium bolleyi]|uniref:Alternative sulfate transporter n=1 Tax=Microdochium bolleyi TaxID=196109 RepID=A0A136J923_9PEZI|nr:alternative sulfate transporter [Microdochium bolleyi]